MKKLQCNNKEQSKICHLICHLICFRERNRRTRRKWSCAMGGKNKAE